MEHILELLETASNQISEAEKILKKISDRESILDAELSQLKVLSDKYAKMNKDLQEKRVNFMTKLCETLLQTVGEISFMIRRDGIYRVSILSGPAGLVIGYRLSQDPSTHEDRTAYPIYFTEYGLERAYQNFCLEMIRTLKNFLRLNPSQTVEQASVLNELFQQVSLLEQT
jgi:hypothetical protein